MSGAQCDHIESHAARTELPSDRSRVLNIHIKRDTTKIVAGWCVIVCGSRSCSAKSPPQFREPLLNHLIRPEQQRRRDGEAEGSTRASKHIRNSPYLPRPFRRHGARRGNESTKANHESTAIQWVARC